MIKYVGEYLFFWTIIFLGRPFKYSPSSSDWCARLPRTYYIWKTWELLFCQIFCVVQDLYNQQTAFLIYITHSNTFYYNIHICKHSKQFLQASNIPEEKFGRLQACTLATYFNKILINQIFLRGLFYFPHFSFHECCQRRWTMPKQL